MIECESVFKFICISFSDCPMISVLLSKLYVKYSV